ncbi:MAG: hypothetical protein WAL29_16085 [Bacteroidales bacterium]
MKKLLQIIFFLTITICFSCEKQGLFEDKGWVVKCSECETTEPLKAFVELMLKVTGTPVKIDVYEGEFEDGVIYKTAETTLTRYTFNAVLNKKYTAVATYHLDGVTYIAVDSAIPRVKYSKEACDEACYFVYDRILDLRLKYLAGYN